MNFEKPKKLNLNKYAFLFYTKGDFYCWIQNDENFLKLANQDEELKNLTYWRYKLKTEKKIDEFEYPAPILDGLDTAKYAKIYYEKRYPELKVIDLSDKYLNESRKITEKLLREEDNFIVFEATFTYNEFSIKTDVLIKKNNVLYLTEVKGVTMPLYYHAIDVMFQYKIITLLGYELDSDNLKLLTLNSFYVYFSKINIEENIFNLFVEWKSYFNSRPQKETLDTSWGIPLSEIMEGEEYFDFFNFFERTLKEIKEIQLLDSPPIEPFEARNFRGMDSDYEDYYLKLKGAGDSNSVFKYSGDSWFSKWKKAQYFDNGYKKIEDLNNTMLISSSAVRRITQSAMNWISDDPTDLFPVDLRSGIRDILFDNAMILKRLIQRNSYITNRRLILYDKLDLFLREFKKVIYMFDFETVQNAVPKIYETSPYEQVPYQYSIHVILDKNDFDFKTMKNVIHLEWLATEKEFYNDFWTNFLRDIKKYGDGSYVSFNKSFENMIIKKRIDKMIYGDEADFLRKIRDETLDLMVPFSNKWYYHNDFNGRYSIKVIAPHFAPEINYKELDKRVQKGDQSAKQCKIWLMNNDEEKANEIWKNVRNAMLKYCMYDTLSMIVIFQRLQELITNKIELNLVDEEETKLIESKTNYDDGK